MFKQIIKLKPSQAGFWSVFTIIILLTLVLLGMGASVMMRSSSTSVMHQKYSVQADYSANAGAYYGIKRLQTGAIDESATIQIGSGSVSLDTSLYSGSTNIRLLVQADVAQASRIIEVELASPGQLKDKAIYTTGNVFNVAGKDSLGSHNSDLVVTNADSIPSIREDSLSVMSAAQGYDTTAVSFSAPTNYPATSFYQLDGVTPNIVHVKGDLVVSGGIDLYGIWIVEGDVTLHGSARIYGVVYLPNATSTIITGGGNPSQSTIQGGIISHGNISGTGNHISVQHQPEYMKVFCGFLTHPDELFFDVINWIYL